MSTLLSFFSRYYIHRCATDTGYLQGTFPTRSSSIRESFISTTVSPIVTDFSKPQGKKFSEFPTCPADLKDRRHRGPEIVSGHRLCRLLILTIRDSLQVIRILRKRAFKASMLNVCQLLFYVN
jgi:hypothetical protein